MLCSWLWPLSLSEVGTGHCRSLPAAGPGLRGVALRLGELPCGGLVPALRLVSPGLPQSAVCLPEEAGRGARVGSVGSRCAAVLLVGWPLVAAMAERTRFFGLGGGGSGDSRFSMRIGGFSLERGGVHGGAAPSTPAATPARIILPMKHAKTTVGLPDILEHPGKRSGLLPQCLLQRYRKPRPPPPDRTQRASSVCSSYSRTSTSSSRLSRSPSPISSSYYSSLSNGRPFSSSSSSATATSRRSVTSPTPAPRRVFPQQASGADLDGIEGEGWVQHMGLGWKGLTYLHAISVKLADTFLFIFVYVFQNWIFFLAYGG